MTQIPNTELPAYFSVPAGSEILAGPVHVEEIMTENTMTLSPEQTVAEVISLLANKPFHHVLVVDGNNHLCGVISDRDVLRALGRGQNWGKFNVHAIMTKDPITVTPDASITVAVKAMLAMRINCIPVTAEDGCVMGILTSTDILKAYERIQGVIEGHRNVCL